MPKVSICCPCYNSEKYIKETVSSFVNQSFEDIEIIISDDCSTDGTYEVIKNNFSDSRIRLFRQEKNLGPSLNSKFIIDQSRSEYLTACAGDDVMDVDRVKKSYELIQENPTYDAVYTFAKIIDGNGKGISHPMQALFNQSKTGAEMLKHFFYSGNFICGTSLTIKKEVYNKLELNPCLLQLQDFDMWVKMLLRGLKMACLPEELTYYRIHGSNLSLQRGKKELQMKSRHEFESTKVLLNFLDYIKTAEHFEEIFQKKLPSDKLVPFAIAKEALLTKTKGHYLFALETIYDEMLNTEKRGLIYKHYNFEIKDFYELCNNFVVIKGAGLWGAFRGLVLSTKRLVKKLIKILLKIATMK